MGILAMKRGSVLALVAFACLAFATSAGAAVYEGHYRGKADWKHDAIFNLTVSKVDGKRYVTQIEWNATRVRCEDGPGFDGRFDYVTPPDGKITRHREFRVNVEYANGEFARVRGEFRRGKGTGIFKARDILDPPSGVCNTGKLRWVAKKT